MAEKAFPPLAIIHGTFAYVSTLFMFEGFCQKPFSAGKGGFNRGMPLSPSREAIRAVSSPHTKAPAPAFMRRSKLKLLPNIFLPRKPFSRASSMALLSLVMARGYSARTYTTPSSLPMAYAPISMPSISVCGSPSITALSINAPGSPSSALQIVYFLSPFAFFAAFHLNHVGKPAPPRPARPETFISFITSSRVISPTHFSIDLYPPFAMYSSIFSGSIMPQFLRAILVCFLSIPPSSSLMA